MTREEAERRASARPQGSAASVFGSPRPPYTFAFDGEQWWVRRRGRSNTTPPLWTPALDREVPGELFVTTSTPLVLRK